MFTTSRKLARTIRSRAAVSPLPIRVASSRSSAALSSAVSLISRRYVSSGDWTAAEVLRVLAEVVEEGMFGRSGRVLQDGSGKQGAESKVLTPCSLLRAPSFHRPHRLSARQIRSLDGRKILTPCTGCAPDSDRNKKSGASG